jgi:uncharacterized protein YecT (DUF1311 family)
MVGLRVLALIFCMIASISQARAQMSPVYDACVARATTQTAMTMCAAEDLTRAQHALNVVYAKLLNEVSGHPETLTKIRVAERAWISYRDAYLEAKFPAKAKQAEYGSIFPMEADLVLADLTRQQTVALSNLLKTATGCNDSETGCIHPSTE